MGKSKSTCQYGQEYELDAEDEEEWGTNFEKDLYSLTTEGLEKGKGKGKRKGKGKGKEKEQEKDKDPVEDDKTLSLPETLKKVKKTKEMLLSTILGKP